MSDNPYDPTAQPSRVPVPPPPVAPVPVAPEPAYPVPYPAHPGYPGYPGQPTQALPSGYAPQVPILPPAGYPAGYPVAPAPVAVRKTSVLTWVFLGMSVVFLLGAVGLGWSNLIAKNEINKRDARITSLQKQVADKDATIADKDKEIDGAKADLADAQDCVDAVQFLGKAVTQSEAEQRLLDALTTCDAI